MVEFGDMLKQFNIMNICLSINDADYLSALHDDYKQSWSLIEAADSLNLKALIKLPSLTSQTDALIFASSEFGITETLKFFRSSELNISIVLMTAVNNNNVDSISKLIELGANIEAKDKYGATPLIVAAFNNSVDSISKLIELGANIEAKNKYGRTALILAAGKNSVDSISKLIELGANIEAKDDEGVTALIAAAFNNNVDSISKLIELGANLCEIFLFLALLNII